nr:sister chromatid cohesion protein PDS5 homolog B-like isoform X1 [Ipomoea batatas]
MPSSGCLPSSDLPAHDGSFNTLLCGDQVNQTQTRRRVRKPNSLMKPEEGYDLTWISAERRSDKTPCQVKPSKKRTARPTKPSERSNSGETSKKRKRKCSPSEKAARKQAEKLVGSRIKVWWPIDQTFYEGGIASFDYFEKKHKVRRLGYCQSYQNCVNFSLIAYKVSFTLFISFLVLQH